MKSGVEVRLEIKLRNGPEHETWYGHPLGKIHEALNMVVRQHTTTDGKVARTNDQEHRYGDLDQDLQAYVS